MKSSSYLYRHLLQVTNSCQCQEFFFFSLLPFPDSESLHSVLVYALTLVLRSLTFPRIYLLSFHPDNLIFSEYGISHHGKTCWACSIDK